MDSAGGAEAPKAPPLNPPLCCILPGREQTVFALTDQVLLYIVMNSTRMKTPKEISFFQMTTID